MIKKAILNELIDSHGLKSVEQHLVYVYLTNNNIDFNQSAILLSYFQSFGCNAALLSTITLLKIATIKDLENHLELLIPLKDRKVNGAFFTPEYIVDFIIAELRPQPTHKNLDPSCGCGAFLVGLTEYYKKIFQKPIKQIVRENIFGSDILEYNINRAKILLTIYALQNGEILEAADFNLYHQDSLKVVWNVAFDNIVGNPPYVKFQDLSEESRESLIKNWTTVEVGSFNLYFAFFELGYKLLKPTGRLGYITPNNYFTSLAGESIRKFFHLKRCITRIIDFTHNKVFDAQTYTALTFLSKQENEAITFDRIKKGYKPIEFLPVANGTPNFLKDLDVKKWRLLKSDEQKNIKTIETVGIPVSRLFDISVGIATLRDDVFFVDGSKQCDGFYLKKTSHGIFEIEKEITKPVYKISDFKTEEQAKSNTRRIIFPYTVKNEAAIPILEADIKNRYPKCYAYLLTEKTNLLGRDKGKGKFDPFFVWGRTQGLTKKGKKILNPTFSQFPRFFLVNEEDAFFTNGYGIYFKEPDNTKCLFEDTTNALRKSENIDVVQKILNSGLMHYYITKTSVAIEGGYPCYQKNFIEKFSIPELNNSEIEKLRFLNNKIDIDEFLIEKYQLNISSPNLFS